MPATRPSCPARFPHVRGDDAEEGPQGRAAAHAPRFLLLNFGGMAQAPEAEKRSSPNVRKYETRGVRRVQCPCARAVRQSRAYRGLRACLAGASARHVDSLSYPNDTRKAAVSRTQPGRMALEHARCGFGRREWASHLAAAARAWSATTPARSPCAATGKVVRAGAETIAADEGSEQSTQQC